MPEAKTPAQIAQETANAAALAANKQQRPTKSLCWIQSHTSETSRPNATATGFRPTG